MQELCGGSRKSTLPRSCGRVFARHTSVVELRGARDRHAAPWERGGEPTGSNDPGVTGSAPPGGFGGGDAGGNKAELARTGGRDKIGTANRKTKRLNPIP